MGVRAGECECTVLNRKWEGVECLKDIVIISYDRLKATHTEDLVLYPVNLFVVGVISKIRHHKIPYFVAQRLRVFLGHFLGFF